MSVSSGPASKSVKTKAREINQEMLLNSTTLTRKPGMKMNLCLKNMFLKYYDWLFLFILFHLWIEEYTDNYIKRITHLHLQSKHIKVIEGLDVCKSLKVLYLYGNMIERIEPLNLSPKLQYINVQNNFIRTLPDFVLPDLVLWRCSGGRFGRLAGSSARDWPHEPTTQGALRSASCRQRATRQRRSTDELMG